MLPKFKIIEHVEEGRPARYSVETDWSSPGPPEYPPNARMGLGVTTGGRLAVNCVTWGRRDLAARAIEQCKRRLR